MEKESREPENLGFIRKYAYNSLGRARRESKIENVDSQRLLHYLDQRAAEDPLFRRSALVDDDGRLMIFFYRDAHCLLGYNIFGDVLLVDTTQKTNKYNLVCDPFIGTNHHIQNFMFRVGFLSVETTTSFERLFLMFLNYMEMKEPDVVFSDQCQALMNDIDLTFQIAKHRLYQWHINHNTTSHFGLLNDDAEFKKIWHHCMNSCDTEDEFDETWKNMIESYELSEIR